MKRHYAPALPIGNGQVICNRAADYQQITARRDEVTCKRCKVLMKPRKEVKK